MPMHFVINGMGSVFEQAHLLILVTIYNLPTHTNAISNLILDFFLPFFKDEFSAMIQPAIYFS